MSGQKQGSRSRGLLISGLISTLVECRDTSSRSESLKENNKNLTSIIITHRITTAKEADKIVVLENGRVAAIGTHQELAAREGLYKHLWEIQGALESEFVKEIQKGEVNGDAI